MKTGYRLAYDSGWKNPCVLQQCLTDKVKAKKITIAFSKLGFKIKLYSDGKWFDIVRK